MLRFAPLTCLAQAGRKFEAPGLQSHGPPLGACRAQHAVAAELPTTLTWHRLCCVVFLGLVSIYLGHAVQRGSWMGRHTSSDSSSSDSDGSRERKRREKKDHKKGKKDKKEKHKKQTKKHSKDKDREKERLLKEAKRFLKQKLKDGDPAAGGRQQAQHPPEPPYDGPIQPISKDDYFTKNAEFAAWLKDTKGVFFSEQSTEQNRAAFDEFVAAWNARRLPARLYKGEARAARTSHAWGIKGGGRALAASGAVGMAAALDEELNLKEQARAAALAERQKQQREAKEWLDEAVPRLTGKDKQLEEKRARRELAKAGRESPDLVGPRGMDVMGGGEDDFAAAKAREAARQDRRGRFQAARSAEVQQRLAAAAAAEDDKMAAFRALLAKGPIQIAKRQ
ncbi:hypothetical protein ABPG77_006161 [Micractinium sp. CCAP 211/92]